MQVVTPRTVNTFTTDVLEDDYPEWVSGNAYAVDDFTMRASIHKVFKCSGANSSTVPPEDNTDQWVDYGATNAYKVLDEYVNTQTEQTNEITMTLDWDKSSLLALFNLDAYEVEITIADSLAVDIFNEIIDLSNRDVSNWFSYFFAEFNFRQDIVKELPFIDGGTCTVVIRKTGSTAKVGLLAHGVARDLGFTLYNPNIGIIDYSKKVTDAVFGNTFLQKGAFSKRNSLSVILDTANLDIVNKRLSDLRATAAIYIGDDTYDSLIIYGFYRDYDITLSNPVKSFLNIEIEGLI